MRIVHISDCYLPRLGGIEIQVQGLAHAQQGLGHDVHVLTATRLLPHQDVTADQVLVHRIVSKLPIDVPIHLNAKRHLMQRLQELQPDVVHIHMGAISQFAWAGIGAAHAVGIPSLTTVHSIWAPWTRWMYRIMKPLTGWHRKTHLAAVSHAAADLVQQTTARQVLVTSNGVDLSGWADGLETESVHSPLRLVSATRFSSRKRVMQLLEMMKQLHAALGENSPTLTVAGNGGQFIKAQQFLARNGLQGVVHLAGRLDRVALKKLFERSDAFIQVSELEAFGLAAIEARAVGLPVLGRSGNGFSEFVEHGVTGYLEDSDAEVAARVIELVQDPERLAKLKRNSAQKPPHQNWDFAVAEVANCYAVAREHIR